MAGIGTAAAGAQPDDETQEQQPDSEAPGQDQPQGGGDPQPNVTPEEQTAYNQLVTNGMKLIYRGDGKDVRVNPAVLDQLRGQWDSVKPSLGQMPDEEKPLDPKNPTDNLAVATVALILALEASAAAAGKKIDPDVLFHGGAELLEQLADIASAAKIHDFTTDELTGAVNRAAMLYGVSTKTQNKQEALAEFQHFLQTQGDTLGQTLGQIGQDGQSGDQSDPDQDSDNDTSAAGDTDHDQEQQ